MTTATMAAATMAATTASVCVNLGRSERGEQANSQDDCIAAAVFRGTSVSLFVEMGGSEEKPLASVRQECRTGSSRLRTLIEFPLTPTETESGSTGPVLPRRPRRRGIGQRLAGTRAAEPPRHDPRHAEDAPRHRLVHISIADRVDLPPGVVRPEQSVAAESRDREFAGIALELTQALSQDADITGAGPQRSGIVAAHLDVLEPPGDLCEARVDDQLPGRAEGSISLACQVCEVRQQAGRVGIIRGQRADDHGIGGPQRDDRGGDGLAVVAEPSSRFSRCRIPDMFSGRSGVARCRADRFQARGLTRLLPTRRRHHAAEPLTVLAAIRVQ